MKIFERVIRKQVTQFLTERGYLNSSQHGFREGRSCLSALLSVYDDFMLMFTESSCSVNMIYLDFSKAFDKVYHGVLLHKLRDMGIAGNLFGFIAFYPIVTILRDYQVVPILQVQ